MESFDKDTGKTAAKKEILLKMRFVLTRLKVEQLRKYVFARYCRKSWDEVLGDLDQDELPLNSRNLAEYLCKEISATKTSAVFELGEKFILLDMCLNSLKRDWHLIELSGGAEVIEYISSDELRESVLDSLNASQLKAHVAVLRMRDNVFLSIRLEKRVTKKPKSRALKPSEIYYLPIFFAIPFGGVVMYTTTSKSKISKGAVNAVASALGFNRGHYSDEKGRDFREVKRTLDWKKHQRQNKLPKPAAPRVKFVPIPKTDSGVAGMDFTSRLEKEKYFDALFGPDPPVLNTMTFAMKQFVPFNCPGAEPWDDVKVKLTLTLRSDNVLNMVKRLTIDDEVFPFPPPSMITDFFRNPEGDDEEDEDDF